MICIVDEWITLFSITLELFLFIISVPNTAMISSGKSHLHYNCYTQKLEEGSSGSIFASCPVHGSKVTLVCAQTGDGRAHFLGAGIGCQALKNDWKGDRMGRSKWGHFLSSNHPRYPGWLVAIKWPQAVFDSPGSYSGVNQGPRATAGAACRWGSKEAVPYQPLAK